MPDIYQVWAIDKGDNDHFVHFTDETMAEDVRDGLKESNKILGVVVNEFSFRPVNKPAPEEVRDILDNLKIT